MIAFIIIALLILIIWFADQARNEKHIRINQTEKFEYEKNILELKLKRENYEKKVEVFLHEVKEHQLKSFKKISDKDFTYRLKESSLAYDRLSKDYVQEEYYYTSFRISNEDITRWITIKERKFHATIEMHYVVLNKITGSAEDVKTIDLIENNDSKFFDQYLELFKKVESLNT